MMATAAHQGIGLEAGGIRGQTLPFAIGVQQRRNLRLLVPENKKGREVSCFHPR